MRLARGRLLVMAALLTVVVALTACGSGETTTSSVPGDASSTTTAANPEPTSTTEAAPSAGESYKIGLVTSLSGLFAAGGSDVRDGAMIAVDKINAAGGIDGHPIELIVEDDGSDVSRAPTSATKLIKQNEVLALAGPLVVALSGSVAAVAEREQMPILMTTASTGDLRGQNYQWVFTNIASDLVMTEGVVAALKQGGYKKVFGISDTEVIWKSVLGLVKEKAAQEGIEVVTPVDPFLSNAVDMTPEVLKLKEAVAKDGVEAVVLMATPLGVPSFLSNMRQLGLELPVVGSPVYNLPPILKATEQELSWVTFPGPKSTAPQALPDDDPQKAPLLELDAAFRAKADRPASVQVVAGYDAMNILAEAIRSAGADKAKIRDALEAIQGYVGAMDEYNYGPGDHDGVGLTSLAVFGFSGKDYSYIGPIE